MFDTTITAFPLSYSKVCDTFRPRIGHCPAIRTDLGGKAFIYFLKPGAMLNSLVRKLITKRRPASIDYRLRHAGLDEGGGVYIADYDVVKVMNNAGGTLVKKVVARIGDLCVNGSYASSFSRPLGGGQRGLGLLKEVLGGDFFAIRQCRQIFQPQVNAYPVDWRSRWRLRHFQHDVQEPVASAVARKIAAVMDFPHGERTRVKHPKCIASEAECITLSLQFAPLERHPSQRFSTAVAQVWAMRLDSRFGVLLANVINRARVQAKLLTAAGGQLNQIKSGMPAAAEAQRVFLPIIAVVPYEVDCSRLLI
jgi:hypothetical protein